MKLKIDKLRKLIETNYRQIAIVFIAFLTMVLVSYFYVSNIVRNQMLMIGEETMNTTQTAISASLSETELIFANITQSTETMLSNGKNNTEILEFLKETQHYYRSSHTYLPDFMKIYGYIRNDFLDGSEWVPPAGYDPKSRPWYIGADENGDSIFFSEPYLDAETGGMCLSFSKKVYDQSGISYGILAIDIKLTRITDYIAGQQISNKGYGILLSDTLQITSHRDQSLLGINMAAVNSDYARLAHMLTDKQAISAERIIDTDGTDSIIFFRTIFNGWHIGLVVPRANYYQQVTYLAIVLSILGFGLMIALSSILVRMSAAKIRSDEENVSKSDFLARMSHEIRTPMNAVKGLSELLALTELSNLQRNYVKNIITSANSLLGIINDILDFSKIDANKLELIESSYDLTELITGVCNIVNMRASEKNLVLLIDASPDLPAALMGDDIRIKQIITNILSNAVKYTNEGYIRLILRMEENEGENWLICAVEDSGIGIRKEDLPLLFNVFSRVDLQANRSIAGTGLGLAISKKLALTMGGDIKVESEYGKGSTFTLRVPQKIVNSRPIASVENPQAKHILLLEGNENPQNLLDMFDSLGVKYTRKSANDAVDDLNLSVFSHCIFYEDISEKAIRSLYNKMPDCLFVSIKDMRHVMTISDCHDTVIYLPIIISEMARILNGNKKNKEILDVVTNNKDDQIKLKNTTFLVVDDNEINLIVSGELLRSFDAEVVCASGGDEAINLCNECKYDIIFMDHMMPGKDGIQTTIEIRNGSGLNKQTPIVALTANVVNDMKNIYIKNGMNDFISKPIELSHINRVISTWLPTNKICQQNKSEVENNKISTKILTSEDLIAAFDNFGLYSSDVMREMNGDFDGYITRMESASNQLGKLVTSLKAEVSELRWEDFQIDMLRLRDILYGVGARDCAARAKKLAAAANEHNIGYIHEDFFSLMGNMFMLDKKLAVLVPFARSDNKQDLPLDAPQFMHVCLEKMLVALKDNNAKEAMNQLEKAAAYSLNMELDMALKAIKLEIEKGDFVTAIDYSTAIFRSYTERLSK